jgi:hypothetical protein
MKKLLCAIALALLLVGQANASIVFSDNFNGYHGGVGVTNYTDFGGTWSVSVGSVDLIGNGYFDFLPGNGLYIDMDGSTNKPGTMVSRTISLNPGDYVLSYQLAGSHRRPDSVNLVTAVVNTSYTSRTESLASNSPFTTFSDRFTVTGSDAVNVTISFAAGGVGDNMGMLLDNVKLEAVPEPATIAIWSILGVVGIAVGCRRKAA